MPKYRICHNCGNKMFPIVKDFTYKNIIVPNVHCFKCSHCGEIIYTSSEAKRIEEFVKKQK